VAGMLASCREMLEARAEFSMEGVRERANQIVKPQITFRILSELTTLCLFYEDLLNQREEAISKSLFHGIIRDLREKVDRYQLAVDFFESKTDQIISARSCMAYVQQFHRRLLELEAPIRAAAPPSE